MKLPMETILSHPLIQKYKQLSGQRRAVFVSAPTGFGKTCAAGALATGGYGTALGITSAQEHRLSLGLIYIMNIF